jgi:predicted CXXCH cytochrome family protein
MSSGALQATSGALVLALSAAVGWVGCRGTVPESAPPKAPTSASNILRSDYAGSAACAPCHASIHERFVKSPMHRMTRAASGQDVRAPFDGRVFEHQGDTVTLERHEGRRYMRLASRARGEELFLITKVIGGRYREDFAGYEVPGIDMGSAALAAGRRELVMPVSWLIFDEGLRYKGYSVMVPERDRLKAGAVWSETCIFCHNTTPFLTTLYDDLGVETQKYQGSVSDQLLPESRRWRYRIEDEAGIRDAVASEIAFLGQGEHDDALDALLPLAAKATRRHFREQHLVEVGIGCEACHNGSRAHAEDPRILPTYEAKSPLLSVVTPEARPPSRASAINRACARCHTVLFSRYEHTWEGGRRNADPGGSNINSGEARDFILGGCETEMSCVDCHDPHAEDSRAHLDALGTVQGNATCTRCHDSYATAHSLAAHTQHEPTSVGSACLSCHMPKKNMGLAYGLTRYHRIGSPTDEARVYGDRPLECALCHVDWSVERTLTAMERGWGKQFDRARIARLYPDLKERVLETSLRSGKPHEQVAAAGALGAHGQRQDAEMIVPLLVHAYPLARYFAKRAIEDLTGEPLPVDLFEPPESVQAKARASLDADGLGSSSD